MSAGGRHSCYQPDLPTESPSGNVGLDSGSLVPRLPFHMGREKNSLVNGLLCDLKIDDATYLEMCCVTSHKC